MPFSKASEILDRHVPAIGAGNAILGRNLPSEALANSILKGQGIWHGPLYMPHRPPVLATPTVSATTLAGLIGANVKAVAAAGGTVDIRAWAGALAQAGVSTDQIGAAYQAAGGDGVLAPAEAAGDTSAFLAAFVSGLQGQGVSDELIAGTYQAAGGRL